MKRSPYPLQWPPHTRRTKSDARRHSTFGRVQAGTLSRIPPSPYEAAKELLGEMRRLGASNVVITSQLPTRHDGLPYADGRSDDPGVAVWCVYSGRERVFACDEWHTVGENLRAIAKSVEAMRGLVRWGMAEVADRAFAGFAALPPGDVGAEPEPSARKPWREVFGVESLIDLATDDLAAVVKSRHRKLIADAHPDRGGDPTFAASLNVALDEALAELTISRIFSRPTGSR